MVQNRLPHDHGQTIEQDPEHMPSVKNFHTVADILAAEKWQPHSHFLVALPL